MEINENDRTFNPFSDEPLRTLQEVYNDLLNQFRVDKAPSDENSIGFGVDQRPYLIQSLHRCTDFECPQCGTALRVEWDGLTPFVSSDRLGECPYCQSPIKYGTDEDGTGWLDEVSVKNEN